MKIETSILNVLSLGIEASLLHQKEKVGHLLELRRDAETVKRLVRVANELKIIETKDYVSLSADLQQVSKMANGWIKSLA